MKNYIKIVTHRGESNLKNMVIDYVTYALCPVFTKLVKGLMYGGNNKQKK
jgi:hypothetical protein